MGEWQVEFTRTPIETTRGGHHGWPADPYRTFVPGPVHATATDPEGNVYTLTSQEIADVMGRGFSRDACVRRVAELIRLRVDA